MAQTVECAECEVEFEGRNSRARFCGATCRKRAGRRAQAAAAAPAKAKRKRAAAAGGDFEAATRRELERLGKVDSMLGQQALVIARRMGNATETGSAVATLSKEHSRLMSAVASGASVADPVDEAVDEVRRKREELDRRRQATH